MSSIAQFTSVRRHRVARLVTGLCSAGMLVACGTPTDVIEYSPQTVVRAYLYAGEPVDDIRLTTTMTLSATDTIPVPVNDAAVSLSRNGVTYTLVKAAGDSGYYRYAGSDLVVREGDVFDLTARVGDVTLTARTQVPVKPGGVLLSSDTIKVRSPGTSMPGRLPSADSGTIMAHWPATSGGLYYVTVENVEAERTAIVDSTIFRVGPGRITFPPIDADSFRVIAPALTYYGRHRLRVYRINEEYAQLYATRQQDTRDLNEPITNINGGLGVFSAFSSDTARFVAVKAQ